MKVLVFEWTPIKDTTPRVGRTRTWKRFSPEGRWSPPICWLLPMIFVASQLWTHGMPLNTRQRRVICLCVDVLRKHASRSLSHPYSKHLNSCQKVVTANLLLYNSLISPKQAMDRMVSSGELPGKSYASSSCWFSKSGSTSLSFPYLITL